MSFNILKHGILYGRKVVFTCKKCRCEFEKPALEVTIGRERYSDDSDYAIFSCFCPECREFVSTSANYKEWFVENNKEA